MAFTSTVLYDGPKNLVILVKADSTTAATVIANADTVSPPCRTFAIKEVVYDIGTGNSCGIFFGTVGPVPVASLSPGSGQTMNFDRWGGISNSNPAVNKTIAVVTTVTGVNDGVTFTLKLRKKY